MFRCQLKALRENASLSQKQLADALHVAQGTVGNWESGTRKPSAARMQEIADLFQVTVDDLLGSTPVHPRRIPVLSGANAGLPPEAVRTVLEYEEIDEVLAGQGEYFALRIQGDSMEPRMYEGDVVIVRQQSDIDSGDIAVIRLSGGEATVKRLIKHGDGISLIAFNPKYIPINFTKREISENSVEVIGKVVELRGKFEL